MRYTEEILWILDKVSVTRKGDTEYQENIDFVHSLGLKCDCVGWSRLKLDDPRAGEILDAIGKFCREQGWQARCLYFRNYAEVRSDWYELAPADFKDASDCSRTQVDARDGGSVYVAQLRPYHETSHGPKYWRGDQILVSDRFRKVCLENEIPGLEFCWAKDVGKYAVEQYFHVYGTQNLPHVAVDRGLCKEDRERIQVLGGWLPRIAEMFYRIQQFNLQDCYLESELPAGGIAAAYCPGTFSYCGRNKLLIHKDTAEVLLRKKAVLPGALRPAVTLDALPGGYVLDHTQIQPRPAEAYMEQALQAYEALTAISRPVRRVSEKEALKVLRAAKRERKADFRKAMPKAWTEELAQSPYSPLLPFYLVVSGGYLSSEYELLPWDQAREADKEFQNQLALEELVAEKPQGVVFAKCPDGDAVLLCRDGTVVRFSHEVPEALDTWPTLAQFFFDALTEQD